MIHNLFQNSRVDFQVEVVVFGHYFPAWTGFNPLEYQQNKEALHAGQIVNYRPVVVCRQVSMVYIPRCLTHENLWRRPEHTGFQRPTYDLIDAQWILEAGDYGLNITLYAYRSDQRTVKIVEGKTNLSSSKNENQRPFWEESDQGSDPCRTT